MISSFTASISSTLTVSRLESEVNGPDELPGVRVGTVEPSAAARYLQRRQIAYHGYPAAADAVKALAAGAVDAVVYEAPVLRYAARNEPSGRVTVLPGTFENHGYGFGLKAGSPIREALDRKLLEVTASDAWTQILTQYLGAP